MIIASKVDVIVCTDDASSAFCQEWIRNDWIGNPSLDEKINLAIVTAAVNSGLPRDAVVIG